MNQAEFAIAVSDAMKLKARTRLKQSTLSGWELGTRQVPAGALLAAAAVAGITVAAALGQPIDDVASRLARLEALVAQGKAPTKRASSLAAGIRADVKRA